MIPVTTPRRHAHRCRRARRECPSPRPPRRSTSAATSPLETRRRVWPPPRNLAFQPNVLARGLLSGRTRTVGLLTDELGGRFAIPILLGVENALGNQQMSVLLCDARGDAIRREHYIRTLLSRQVDGLIVVGETNDIRPSLGTDVPVPVVYVYGESDNPDDLSILADDHGGGRLAAEHLSGTAAPQSRTSPASRPTAPPGNAPPASRRSSTRPATRS